MLHADLNENKVLVSLHTSTLTIICLNCHSIINIYNIPMIYPKLHVGNTGLHVVNINPLVDIIRCPHCYIDSDDATPETLFEIDEEIAYDIFQLNMKGYVTLYSCAGHEIKNRNEFGSEFFYCMFKLKRCSNRDMMRNIIKTIVESFDTFDKTIPNIEKFHHDVFRGCFEAVVYTEDISTGYFKETAVSITKNNIEVICDFIEAHGYVSIRLGISPKVVTNLMEVCDEDEVPSLQWYNDFINMGARNALHFIAENLPIVDEYLTEEYMVPDCIPSEIDLDYDEDLF